MLDVLVEREVLHEFRMLLDMKNVFAITTDMTVIFLYWRVHVVHIYVVLLHHAFTFTWQVLIIEAILNFIFNLSNIAALMNKLKLGQV